MSSLVHFDLHTMMVVMFSSRLDWLYLGRCSRLPCLCLNHQRAFLPIDPRRNENKEAIPGHLSLSGSPANKAQAIRRQQNQIDGHEKFE